MNRIKRIRLKLAVLTGMCFGLLCGVIVIDSPAMAACTGSSPTWTSTPDVASVSTCVSSASTGDTVNVSAGSATWSSGLTITKNLSLIGAGIGNTVITANTGTLISYTLTNNATLARVSGFTFNMGGSNCAMDVSGSTVALGSKLDRIRIDHNRFTNTTCTSSNGNLNFTNAWGVVDHNTIDNVRVAWRAWGTGTGANNWSIWGDINLGTDQTLWFEDNTITLNGSSYMVADCDLAGRYSARYNSLAGTSIPFPWFDWHGWTSSGNQGCFGGEVYGNIFSSNGGPMISQRGGRAMIFYNSTTSGVPAYNVYNNNGCPGDERQKINNTYVWNNRNGNTGGRGGWQSTGGDNCGTAVVENSTFWIDGSNATGVGVTNGVGAGTLAARSATCMTGVGYWATDQSITDLTGMVGPNPTTPISGTLYKCTSTNTWTSYYTPFTYPHPLTRITASTDGAPPSPPQGLRIQ